MNIAFVTNEFVSEKGSYDGGLSNYLYSISSLLVVAGHQVTVLVRAEVDEDIDFNGIKVCRVKYKQSKAFKILDVLTRFKKQKLLVDIFQSYAFRKKLQSLKAKDGIDIVQYSNLHMYYFLHPRRIPFVIRLSSFLQVDIEEARAEFYMDALKFRLFVEKSIIGKNHKRSFLPSQKLQGQIRKCITKELRIIETPFANIPRDNWNPSALDIINFKDYCLFFGRFIEKKGVIELSEALNQLFQNGHKLNFVFMGKDKDHNGKMMSDIIKENIDSNYHQYIQIVSAQEKNNLYPIISGAKLVVLPSRWDNLANAGIETLSLGVPLIGSRGASFEQLINHEENGFLCEKNNSVSIAESILKFLSLSVEEQITMSKGAKDSVKRLEGDNIVKELLAFYDEVCKSY